MSAPTLMRSTPDSASARTVTRFTPPDASSWIDGAALSRWRTASVSRSGPRLSRRMMSGPQARRDLKLFERVDFNLDDGAGRCVGTGGRDRRGNRVRISSPRGGL